ncbi:hypothetical protein [Caedibacter taeniospiralis]|uniref:hypothetical protein n=1 Tax=Caedibacter taeniospiralis TaxID=28907 RepID=UPI000C273940|nr:hypothetical protein [Caedibacter taeniospiralis]
MPNNQSVQNMMGNVQKNHQNYLEKTIKTQLNLTTSVTKESEERIKLLMMRLETSYPKFTAQIAHMFEGLSMGAKVKNGVLAVGAGAATGLLVNQALSNAIPVPDFIPGKNLAVAGISVAISSVVAKAFYDVWPGVSGQVRKPAIDSEEFQKQLNESGFLELSKDLTNKFIRLFHYRESLLFGKQPDMPIDMRAEFKGNLKDASSADEFKIAVETYFLTELDKVFRDTFKEIYTIHNEQIQDDKNSSAIMRTVKRYFGHVDPDTFTQQLQVGFLSEVSGFLAKQMDEPTILARHPYLVASIAGLAAGALVFAIAPVSIALVAGVLIGIAAYFLPSYFDSLTFKRSQENREALKKITDAIDNEAVKLRMHTQQVVATSNVDIKNLQNYVSSQCDGKLYNAYILVGSSKSWLEEYAARYRHSKRIETDLGDKAIKPIAATAQRQTGHFTKALTTDINDNAFKTCIEKTQDYVNHRNNSEFIERFHVKTKIRDQLFEIVSALPKNKPLPQYVTDFYVNTLGGVAHDLVQVREITTQNELKSAAKSLNVIFGTVENENQAFILKGDNSLRHLLNLPASGKDLKLDKDNINQYLTQSMHFMFSLLKKPEINLNADNPLNQVFTYTDEFSIYHTLLLKQLAALVDPNNDKLDGDTKAAINLFLKEKLSVDPKDLLNHAFTDALLVGNRPTLDNMGELIRSAIACSKLNYTPKALLKAEVKDQINNHLFALHDDEVNFIPEASEAYLQRLKQTITSTAEFVEKIKQNPILVATGACGVYLYEVQQEIIKTLKSIDQYINDNQEQPYLVELKKAQTELGNYKTVIDKELGSQKMTYVNPEYYQLIDKLIAQVETYETSQHGTLYNDNNKIKVAKAILKNLQKLKGSAISDKLEEAIFTLANPTEQDFKDLADLKLNKAEFGQLKKIAADYTAYMSELNNHQDARENDEVFYSAEEDNNDNDSAYEDYEIIFNEQPGVSQVEKKQS